ncbi:MAG: acyltransferase [Ruminococcus sp.]|nr:acyltransferase [Ruminococcus sp.]
MNKRIHYIDNLRWLTVSLLVLYHAAMAYNTWNEANYIFFDEVRPIAAIVTFISPWFMPLMFLLAGVSARYSLQKRGYGTFIKERFIRLGIPFVSGLLVIDPIMSYIADISHNGYGGNFFEHYGVYFTRFTDLSGYDGGFTLGHFWFLGVLIIISLLSCVIIKLIGNVGESGTKAVIVGVVLTIAAAAMFDIDILGKRVPTYLCVYLLGYYFFSQPSFAKSFAKFKIPLTLTFLTAGIANTAIFIFIGGLGTLNTVCNYAAFLFGVGALMAIAHDHLDFTGRFSGFNARVSYVFYILHYPLVVLCQYFLGRAGLGSIANFVLTLVICYPLTFALCAAVDKSRYIRVLFGSKAKRKEQVN